MHQTHKKLIWNGDVVKKPWFRLLIGLGFPILMVCGAYYLYYYKSPFPCVFYQVSHLYCSGCGSGRAAYSLLHLNLMEAFHYNIFFVLVLPFLAYYIAGLYLRVVMGRELLPMIRITPKQFIIILSVVLLYGILRNIPVVPFDWFAPGG